jgi:hypothetical protein
MRAGVKYWSRLCFTISKGRDACGGWRKTTSLTTPRKRAHFIGDAQAVKFGETELFNTVRW